MALNPTPAGILVPPALAPAAGSPAESWLWFNSRPWILPWNLHLCSPLATPTFLPFLCVLAGILGPASPLPSFRSVRRRSGNAPWPSISGGLVVTERSDTSQAVHRATTDS